MSSQVMKSPQSKHWFRGFSHVLAALFSNASHFHREWFERKADHSAKESIQGRWQGEWLSDANGHHGQVKGILAELAPGQYKASFYATYAKFLRVCYSVTLNANDDGGRTKLKCDADLGQLAGGIYYYEGEATPTDFKCEYRCQYDHGTFQMKRPDSNNS